MNEPEIFRIGDDRLLCDAWHARSRTVVLRPGDPRRRLTCGAVEQVVAELAGRGVDRILTAALDGASVEPFAAAGFVPHDDLCVLRHDLAASAANRHGTARHRAGRHRAVRRGSLRRDLARAAAIDQQAFAAGTALDQGGLRAIVSATPAYRFRLVAPGSGQPAAAYAMCGIAGDTGYVQRLAVDPTRRRHGYARALVADALGWFDRRRVGHVLVNTQVTNVAAQALYVDAGFVRTPDRLAVWAWRRGVTP